MARIKLQFYDKTYTIEYANRSEVKEYFAQLQPLIGQEENAKNSIKALTILIKAGLVEHHENDMPSDADIDRWITSIPNPDEFYKKLMSMVQLVINSIDSDSKNLKWEVEEN